MSRKTKLIFIACYAAFGAAYLWSFVVIGQNASPAKNHSVVAEVTCYLVSIVLAGWASQMLTRGQSAAVRLRALIGSAIGISALSWLTTALGWRAWVSYGPSWHAALAGFVIFAFSAAVCLYRSDLQQAVVTTRRALENWKRLAGRFRRSP